jgi:hypothetical protein
VNDNSIMGFNEVGGFKEVGSVYLLTTFSDSHN